MHPVVPVVLREVEYRRDKAFHRALASYAAGKCSKIAFPAYEDSQHLAVCESFGYLCRNRSFSNHPVKLFHKLACRLPYKWMRNISERIGERGAGHSMTLFARYSLQMSCRPHPAHFGLRAVQT